MSGPSNKTQTMGAPQTVLPDDLIAKIITMMPFPNVFRARNLSKTWRSRFSLISAGDDPAQHDEDEKRLAVFRSF